MLRILTTLALAIASTEAVPILSTPDANTGLGVYTIADDYQNDLPNAINLGGGRWSWIRPKRYRKWGEGGIEFGKFSHRMWALKNACSVRTKCAKRLQRKLNWTKLMNTTSSSAICLVWSWQRDYLRYFLIEADLEINSNPFWNTLTLSFSTL